jgi:hypothetical protein
VVAAVLVLLAQALVALVAVGLALSYHPLRLWEVLVAAVVVVNPLI